MRDTLIYFLKKYVKILALPLALSIAVLVICTIRTNKCILLKGDTSLFTDIVDVDTEYESRGTFSTIYVESMEKSTVFQNWIVSGLKTAETYTISTSSTHLTDSETYQASKIQYNSAITNSIVLAYKEAMKEDSSIHLAYSFAGFDVTYYKYGSSFRIGDRIVKIRLSINDNLESTIEDETDFRRVINMISSYGKEGDVITVIRNGVSVDISYKPDADSGFGAYSIYSIDTENTYPSLTIKSTNIGGPSGGLLQTLSIYNQLVPEDLTHGLKIAGTGTISYTGDVGMIGGIREKIPTALDDHIDVFFCVEGNYEDAYDAYMSLPGHDTMKLVKIKTFQDALDYLKGVDINE